jgi:hypothetical protein
MKSLRLLLVGLLLSITGIFTVSAQAADPSLTVSGVTLSWPAVIYQPVSTSQVTVLITNNSSYELLTAKYSIQDKFGTQVASGSKLSVPRGLNSITENWYARDIDKGTAPFTITFSIQFYASSGVPNAAPVTTAFEFASRSGGSSTPVPAPTVTVTATPAPAPRVTVTVTPAPAPTVTVTATPAPAPTVTVTATPAPAPTVYVTNPSDKNLTDLVTSLKSQVNLLNAKLKKICAVKPKPRNC